MTPEDAAPLLEQAKAYHQAGHAVMAFMLGFPATRLELCPEDGALGYDLPEDLVRLSVRNWLLITLAGHHAEIKFLGPKYATAMYETPARLAFDMIDILRAFEKRGIKSAGVSEHLRGKLGKMLATLFNEEAVWQAVQNTAEALNARSLLDAASLFNLIPKDLARFADHCRDLSCEA